MQVFPAASRLREALCALITPKGTKLESFPKTSPQSLVPTFLAGSMSVRREGGKGKAQKVFIGIDVKWSV